MSEACDKLLLQIKKYFPRSQSQKENSSLHSPGRKVKENPQNRVRKPQFVPIQLINLFLENFSHPVAYVFFLLFHFAMLLPSTWKVALSRERKRMKNFSYGNFRKKTAHLGNFSFIRMLSVKHINERETEPNHTKERNFLTYTSLWVFRVMKLQWRMEKLTQRTFPTRKNVENRIKMKIK